MSRRPMVMPRKRPRTESPDPDVPAGRAGREEDAGSACRKTPTPISETADFVMQQFPRPCGHGAGRAVNCQRVHGLPHEIFAHRQKGSLKGQTMKKTVGICMLAAASAFASHAFAETPQTVDGAARWSASTMDRHMPVDAARLHTLGQKKFRYMDMAETRRSKSLQNAVLLYGTRAEGKAGDGQRGNAKAAPSIPVYRDHAQPRRPRVIMRPST